MELMKKILLVLICIVSLNYNSLIYGIEINEQNYGSSISGHVDNTIECGDYSYIDSAGAYIVEYRGNEETLYLPTELDGKKVVGIYSECFALCTNTKKIVIPNTIETIFDDAFINCSCLEEIEVLEGNEYYASKDGMLYSTDYYYLVKVPEGKKGAVTILNSTYYICDFAFLNCTKVTSVHIPASLVGTDGNGDYGVGIGAFWGTESLETITVDSKSRSYVVYDGVLYKLKNNTTTKEVLIKCPDTRTNCVYIPPTVTEIADYAFCGCENLVGPINLPSNLIKIGERAFCNCKSLDGAINLPDTTTSLGSCAFYTCESLEELNIGNGIKDIPTDCFAYCTSLKKLTIPNSVTDIRERAFFYCTGVESLTLGNNVASIESWAFDYFKSLKGDLIIPDSVRKIGTAAFMNLNNIDGYIIIGENVNEVGTSAFYHAENSKGVIFKGELPTITKSTFLKPDIPYYYLEGKGKFAESILSQKDLRIYNEKPVVDFIVNDEIYETVNLDSYAMQVEPIEEPVVDNYNFIGWYYDTNYTQEYSFEDDIMANTSLYAKLELKNEIIFEKEETTIEVGQQEKVNYTYELVDGVTIEDIIWESTDDNIATVDEYGNITAISKGEVTITATYDNAQDSIKVIVWQDENKLEILQDTLTIEKGQEFELEYEYHFVDELATQDDILWESSNSEILSVEHGKITTLTEGFVTITATYENVQDSIEVIILKNNVLVINTEDCTLKTNKILDLDFEYYFNDNATEEDIVWQSSNTNVAKVENGKVTTLLEGEVTITATYKNVSDSVIINVVSQDKFEFNAEKIKLNNTITEYVLEYSWYSYDKTEQEIVWESSNNEVATVENGIITLKECGETIITATCGDVVDTIIVKIVRPNSINFVNDNEMVRFEKDAQVELELDYYFNDDATYSNITFESDNEEVIKVLDNKLIQVGIGTANITARYGDVNDTIMVDVVPQDYIEFKTFGHVLKQGEELALSYDYYIYRAIEQITFESSDENVAKVDEYGNIITLNEGEAIITASYGDITAQIAVVVKDKEYKLGDINLDGLVDSADAAIALNLYKYNSGTNIEKILGDLNEDKLIDSADAALILNIFKYNL